MGEFFETVLHISDISYKVFLLVIESFDWFVDLIMYIIF